VVVGVGSVVGVLSVGGHGLGKYSRLRVPCTGARGWTTAGWRSSFLPVRGRVKWCRLRLQRGRF
jgi:hypothetical protein